jgi:hypothetical protein
MVECFGQDRFIQLGPPIAIRPGYHTPRRPNFSQNMQPIKLCRRSLARQNRTTPEYPDVYNGVSMGLPRQFCFIPPAWGWWKVGPIGDWVVHFNGSARSYSINHHNQPRFGSVGAESHRERRSGSILRHELFWNYARRGGLRHH